MKKLETVKRLFNNLLTVYSGTVQNTSHIQKIFLSANQNSFVYTPTLENGHDSSDVIDTASQDLITERTKDNLDNIITDNLTINIEELNISVTRNSSDQDPTELSIILPKTEIKKTFYHDEKITSTTEIVLSNLTILHNPRGGSQIVSTTDNSGDAEKDKPKLTIGFNTEEIEKAPS